MNDDKTKSQKYLKEIVQMLFRVTAELSITQHPDPADNERIKKIQQEAAGLALRVEEFIRSSERDF